MDDSHYQGSPRQSSKTEYHAHRAVEKGVCLCAHHHSVVHGYRIERVSDQTHGLEAQFQQQQATTKTTNEIEQRLRNSRESFEQGMQVILWPVSLSSSESGR